jgi:hypothetical protein
MEKRDPASIHKELSFAGFRALATAAGLLQLTRELRTAGVLDDKAIDRIQASMVDELLASVPRTLAGKPQYENQLRNRLKGLFAGSETLGEKQVGPPDTG